MIQLDILLYSNLIIFLLTLGFFLFGCILLCLFNFISNKTLITYLSDINFMFLKSRKNQFQMILFFKYFLVVLKKYLTFYFNLITPYCLSSSILLRTKISVILFNCFYSKAFITHFFDVKNYMFINKKFITNNFYFKKVKFNSFLLITLLKKF